MSIPVKENANISDLQPADTQLPTHDMSGLDTTGQGNGTRSGRQDYPAGRRALLVWASPRHCAPARAVELKFSILSRLVGATGLSRRSAGSARLGFAPALRFRASSRTEVLILSRLVGATGFELGYWR